MRTIVIVPTFNEAPNVEEVVRRVAAAMDDGDTELLFVDDSTDDTPGVVERVALSSSLPVRLLHRDEPVGGLSGAVLDGIAASDGEWCVVMDGDLQHPPELIPRLIEAADDADADIAIASRYFEDGSCEGLDGPARRAVSRGSVAVARLLFPVRLSACTDPMTGFFAFKRSAIDVDCLHPRGFKILLEILARHSLRVVERPLAFGERIAGTSKATTKQGLSFLYQLLMLRFGRMSRFATIGFFGAIANLLIMAGLVAMSVNYLQAAVVAAVVTILGNFFLQERFVFSDLIGRSRSFRGRFTLAIGANSLEAAARLPVLAALVELLLIPSLVAQAITLAAAFVLRFLFHTLVVYRTVTTRKLTLAPEVAVRPPPPALEQGEAA